MGWEKFKFRLSDCFSRNYCRMHTLWGTRMFFFVLQCSPYCSNILLQISHVTMPADHKKQMIAQCSRVVQFASSTTIFKETTNLTLTHHNHAWYVVTETTAMFHSASTAPPLQANSFHFLIHLCTTLRVLVL